MNKKLRSLINKSSLIDDKDEAQAFIFKEMEKFIDELTDDDFDELVNELTSEVTDLLKELKKIKKQKGTLKPKNKKT